MDPYYAQWKSSKHAGVKCIKCHSFKPLFITVTTIKYLTGLYNPKPHAKVDNGECMAKGCHASRLEKPEAYLGGKVLFNHKEHLTKMKRGESLRCTSCHYQIVQGEHISVDKNVCFLCHFKGMKRGQSIGGCKACHGVPTKEVTKEGFHFSHDSYLKLGVECKQCHLRVASGDGDVPEGKCFQCHVGKNRKNYDRVTLHRIHVTLNGIDCFKCHGKIRHGEVQLVRVFEVKCNTCHKKLHSSQKEMYMGTGARGVPDTPSRMFSAQVACDGCHTQPVQEVESGIRVKGEKRLTAEKKNCVLCHGKGYGRMLDDWVASSRYLEKLMGGVKDKADKITSSLTKEKRGKEISDMVADIEYNYAFLKSGRGAHNIEYAWRIVRTAYTQFDLMAKLLKRKSVKRPPLISNGANYCTKFCHGRLGLPSKVYFKEMQLDFPHKLHVEEVEITCTACHSPEKHKMRIVTKSECMACHHEGEDVQCSRCHSAQEKLYDGKVTVAGIESVPDPMKEGEVACTGCHDLQSGKPQNVVVVKEKCAGCHDDPSYADMALTWEKELLELENRAVVQIEEAGELVKRMKRLGRDTSSFESLLASSRKSYTLVSKGRGIHNYELSKTLLQKALDNLGTITMEKRKQ